MGLFPAAAVLEVAGVLVGAEGEFEATAGASEVAGVELAAGGVTGAAGVVTAGTATGGL